MNICTVCRRLALFLFVFLCLLESPDVGFSAVATGGYSNNVRIYRPGSHTSKLRKRVGSEKRMIFSKQVGTENTYQNSLDGNWDYVTGFMGFFYTFEDLGEAFISIIGLETTSEGNGVYQTVPWERKAFWLQVDDGPPLHIGAEFVEAYEDPDYDNQTVYYFTSKNILFQQNGYDYSGTEWNGEWTSLKFITDTDYNVLDYNVQILDENDEVVDERSFEIGDAIQSWTVVFDLNDASSFWVTTMEENFRTITREPQFSFTHLTPNKDFTNDLTRDLIDFSNIDLKLVLLGELDDANGNATFQYSAPMGLGLKWDNAPASEVADWMLHLLMPKP